MKVGQIGEKPIYHPLKPVSPTIVAFSYYSDATNENILTIVGSHPLCCGIFFSFFVFEFFYSSVFMRPWTPWVLRRYYALLVSCNS